MKKYFLENRESAWARNRYSLRKAASIDSSEDEQNWLITLSDLMSLLLIFFIVFVALAKIPVVKKTVPSPPLTEESSHPAGPAPSATLINTIRSDMESKVTSLGLGEQVMIQGGPQEILISLKDYISFASGEAELLKTSQPVLDTIAEIVERYPSFQVEIDGHTDDQPIKTGPFPSNWELSVARAASVLRYLINRRGLDPSRFTIKGYGEQQPLTSNQTLEQRAQNRRVEIRLKNRTITEPV
ncbi:MAG: flagellar motor protein MotB [Thermodesulfobacteriota bacterium]